MEHPYLFFSKLFEAVGLAHFAHSYTHVIYTWVAMAVLIIFALFENAFGQKHYQLT